LIISFLWWILLLVSIFISPPMMHTRGSGFFDFSYTTLTVGNLILVILFFTVPSKAMQVSQGLIALLLLIDMIIIVTTPRLRFEEGWIGITSVVWALAISIFNIITDRVVAWGKKEEEERLTGRSETRRTLRQWLAVFASNILMVVLFIIVLFMTATLIIRARDATLEPPGKRYYVDGNKYQVHLDCVGEITRNAVGVPRNPTVIVEAGEMPFEDTFDDFIYSAYKNGTIDRYCYWDRPGMGWSDNAPSPFSAGNAAGVLSEALAQAGETGPYVLVSAGIGGIYSRVFASRHPGEVKGLFLIDALQEDLLSRVGGARNGFFLWLRGVISPLGLSRIPGALFSGRTREDRVYGRSSYQTGKFIKHKLQEALVAETLTRNDVISAGNILNRKTPLVVVSSGEMVRRDAGWREGQEKLKGVSSNLVGEAVVEGAGHEIWRRKEGRDVMESLLKNLMTEARRKRKDGGLVEREL
jgi:pimeloyl-ACP methyl ester carboxylesterase